MMNKKLAVVSCPIACRAGYGARSRDFVRSLVRIKGDEWDIKVLPQRWGNTPQTALTDKDADLLKLIIPRLEVRPDIWIQITIPSEFERVGTFNIGVSAVIETDTASDDFVNGCNRMDLTIVSSKHSATTLTNRLENVDTVSLQKPVDVLFEGFDSSVYDNKKPQLDSVNELLSNIDEDFAFLFVGHWLPGQLGHDRKNVSGLVNTFFEAFKNKKKKPALILKTSIFGPSVNDVYTIQKNIESIRGVVDSTNLPNVYLINGDLSDDEMNSLYNHPKVKAHVSFTRGEGFGRPLLEACVSGKPIIASNWSGHTDFLNPDFNYLIGGKLDNVHPSAANEWLRREKKWFTINYGEAMSTMRWVFENYKSSLEKSRKNRKYVKDNFTFEKMDARLSEILSKYDSVIPKQVELKLPTLNLPKMELPKLKKIES